MKRIIDGITYNTDTSTRLATSEYEASYNHLDYPCIGALYQTRGGAYFVHEQIDLGRDPELGEIILKDRFDALSTEEAQKWLMTSEVEVFHNPFEDPPEAEAETEPSATIYVRVPTSLKQRLEQSAKAEKLSGNSWAIRCIERCLSPDVKVRNAIGRVWHLARKITHETEVYTQSALIEMAEDIAGIIENNWEKLGFAEGEFDEDILGIHASELWGYGDDGYERQKD